jgi:hypothetical protein
MTTTPTGLADRAITEARHRRATDPDGVATRDDNWPRWTYRAKAVRMIAQRFGLPAFAVTVTDDPDRRYGLRHQFPGDLITVRDPATAVGTGTVLRFVPDFTAPSDRWLLIDDCPECGAPVPMARVATIADLGDYLDPDNDTWVDHLPAEHHGDPAHHARCSHRD